MPSGLEIDRGQPLNGTMAPYAEQILISTGRSDWTSRIEDEDDAVLAKRVKELLGRGGKYSDPFHNVMLTNSSFTPSTSTPDTASAYLFPSFRYLPEIRTDTDAVEKFLKAFVLPSELHPAHGVLAEPQREALIRDRRLQEDFPGVQSVDDIVVLICGHGGRDQRCGILGPLLQAEFEDKLQMEGTRLRIAPPSPQDGDESDPPGARVGLISHIGGHKYAGNVIIYIPPSMKWNPLAGKGIWYGRVSPANVEGIVKETILNGKVIKEMFRGGVEQGSKILRL
ncbi:Altered inheritance of mitochondria protein 32 [Coniosporium apollinis]|uniref:Altered inheritance of mitochondria protein 32 n=1 Tax=Coniosporium apollinis TaxID=61459 RepID=A0ABQ9NNB1_9PEZI|nr:Altered inheritance of mitochondria protein 32 [Coniosporium apollinis]